jgi:Kef-type K+ transport system membrane component KefB
VVAVAFLSLFLLGLAPRLRLPSVVFEIVAGIVIAPSVLGRLVACRPSSIAASWGSGERS